MVFIDTPGIHKAKSELNQRMVEVAISAISDMDLMLLMVDVANPDPPSEKVVVNHLQIVKKPVVLALNKIDLIKKEQLLSTIDKWSATFPFSATVPISATNGQQVEKLLEAMEECLPEGPPYFPEDTLTDMPERFIAAEMIREKVFRFTGEEIPYATAVTVESFKEEPQLIRIQATIHVEKDSQKGIVIGKKGAKLKQIGREARLEIERMVGTKVFLKLFVRVQKNWSKDTKALRRLGY
jgi:GTP-binding protein Era